MLAYTPPIPYTPDSITQFNNLSICISERENLVTQFRFEAWPTEYRVITQDFGARPNVYGVFGLPGHDGIDIRARTGTSIFSVAAGTVDEVDVGRNLGNYVRVRHIDNFQTTYAHLSEVMVAVGQTVTAGQLLGLAGETGNAHGAHLHLALKKLGATYSNWPYNLIDPTPFLLPLLNWAQPQGETLTGWMLESSLLRNVDMGQVHIGGARVWIGTDKWQLVPGNTIVELTGEEKSGYVLVRVTLAALGLTPDEVPQKPDLLPQPTVATVDGWGWERFLAIEDEYALINPPGVNLRQSADVRSTNTGFVRIGSTVRLLGEAKEGYRPMRVLLSDIDGALNLPQLPPLPNDIETLPTEPHDDSTLLLGWVRSAILKKQGIYAQVDYRYGAALYPEPMKRTLLYARVKGFAQVTRAGADKGKFTPILARREDVFGMVEPLPLVQAPDGLPDGLQDIRPKPHHDTTPGWMLTAEIAEGTTGSFPASLHTLPHRDAPILAQAEPHAELFVVSQAEGEFTPVRVNDKQIIWRRDWNQTADEPIHPITFSAQVRIGLTASTDMSISDDEIALFKRLRPGILKISSLHDNEAVEQLCQQHRSAHWIIRAHHEFNGQNVSPSQFIDATLANVREKLSILDGKFSLVSLHEEQNSARNGWGASWNDGTAFSSWWLDVVQTYRHELPDVPFIYPGVALGGTIQHQQQDHILFMEQSREAVESADALAVHLHWSTHYPLPNALAALDDLLARFPMTRQTGEPLPVYVTKAVNTDPNITPREQAEQYLQCWHALQIRHRVKGVTFFVASSSDPALANQVWLDRGIAKLVGQR